MAKVLLVDSNSDHRKSLKGLFAYRMSHTVVMVKDCVSGARACVSERPDLVMINLLLFLDSKFAFARALGGMGDIGKISILVHTSGALEDLTRRLVEVNGAAGIVELPCSGDELEGEIDKAINVSRVQSESQEVQSVSWPKAGDTGEANGKREPKPVDWGEIASKTRSKPRQPGNNSQPQIRAKKSQPSQPVQNGNAFRPVSYDSVDPSTLKGSSYQSKTDRFEKTVWRSVDPDRIKKNRGRKG